MCERYRFIYLHPKRAGFVGTFFFLFAFLFQMDKISTFLITAQKFICTVFCFASYLNLWSLIYKLINFRCACFSTYLKRKGHGFSAFVWSSCSRGKKNLSEKINTIGALEDFYFFRNRFSDVFLSLKCIEQKSSDVTMFRFEIYKRNLSSIYFFIKWYERRKIRKQERNRWIFTLCKLYFYYEFVDSFKTSEYFNTCRH